MKQSGISIEAYQPTWAEVFQQLMGIFMRYSVLNITI